MAGEVEAADKQKYFYFLEQHRLKPDHGGDEVALLLSRATSPQTGSRWR